MPSFIYVKAEGKAQWRLITNSQEDLFESIRQGARFTTVLNVDKDVDVAQAEDQKVLYQGPLYFDLDSHDEEESLRDLRSLLLQLYNEYGVSMQDLRVWATGGKGFHVLIHPKVFSKGRPSSNLAYTYRNMASQFDLPTLDYGIYSQGKGRMWRIQNLKRPNDRYKVPLTLAEVFGCDMEYISKKTYEPQEDMFLPDDVSKAPQLSALFQSSIHKPKKVLAIANEEVQKLEEDPECIKKILAKEGINENRRFNQIAMTVAGYYAARGYDSDQFIAAVEPVVQNYTSSVYKKDDDKRRHLRSIFNYVAAKGGEYRFSCDHARKNVHELRCALCKLERGQSNESLGIEALNNAYFKIGADGQLQQISTFVIEPVRFVRIEDNGHIEHCINALLVAGDGIRAPVVFNQPDWGSKSALLKRLPSPVYAYWGGDGEVQKIFHLMSKTDVPTQRGVKAIGLHEHEGRWHFVSQAGSIDAGGTKDELLLPDPPLQPTELLAAKAATKEDLQQMSGTLWKFNDPLVAMPILGWHVLCFFKQRFFKHTESFPLLFVFGEAGAGKTKSVVALRKMFSLHQDFALKSVGEQTKFTMTRYCSNSNLLPAHLDEFKASSFSDWQRKNINAVIRSAYNGQSADRGQADQSVLSYPLINPIAFIGEQTVTEKAARDRIIEVQLTCRMSAPHLENFEAMSNMPLERLGRSLLNKALTISDADLMGLFEQEHAALEGGLEDRPRTNVAMLMSGFKLLAKVFDDHEVNHDLELCAMKFKKLWLERQADERHELRKSDVDRIFEVMDMMTEADRLQLFVNDHYTVDAGVLYLDMKRTYAYTKRFIEEFRIADVEAMTFNSFSKLVVHESYFKEKNVEHIVGGEQKMCYAFDPNAMLEKGLHVRRLTSGRPPSPNVELG